MFKAKLNRKDSGFTIIEVLIVLAIGALILAVVLVAIPQLQRNQRNNARQALMARISSEIGNYAANNNGNIPTAAADITSFTSRYLSGVDTKDPKTGSATTISYVGTSPTVDSVPAGTTGTASYRDGVSCDGEKIAAGTGRSFALWTQLEGGAIYCLDNM